jgi:hypothetical protein
MALPWVFYIVMAMPSYAGPDPQKPVPLVVTVEAADQKTCKNFQEFLTKEMKKMSLKFVPTDCIAKPEAK